MWGKFNTKSTKWHWFHGEGRVTCSTLPMDKCHGWDETTMEFPAWKDICLQCRERIATAKIVMKTGDVMKANAQFSKIKSDTEFYSYMVEMATREDFDARVLLNLESDEVFNQRKQAESQKAKASA